MSLWAWPMSRLMVGTCLAEMPTTALVPHSIGATIPSCATYQLNHLLCITEVVPIPLLVKCPKISSLVRGPFSILLMHPSVLSNQQGDRLLYMPGSCSSWELQSGVQQDCSDVDTTTTASFAKLWKPVQKPCNTSRCTIRCFWGWSPHQACCWPNSSLESNTDSGRSLQTQCSDESEAEGSRP